MHRFSYRTEQAVKFVIAAVAIVTLFTVCTWVSMNDTNCSIHNTAAPSTCNNGK